MGLARTLWYWFVELRTPKGKFYTDNSDIMDFFRAEYKKDARSAYEYYSTTGTMY